MIRIEAKFCQNIDKNIAAMHPVKIVSRFLHASKCQPTRELYKDVSLVLFISVAPI